MSLISLLTQGHIRGNVSHNSINLGNHTRWNQYFYRFTLTEMTINTWTLQWENDCREQLSDVEYLRRYIPSLFLILPAYPWIKVKEICVVSVRFDPDISFSTHDQFYHFEDPYGLYLLEPFQVSGMTVLAMPDSQYFIRHLQSRHFLRAASVWHSTLARHLNMGASCATGPVRLFFCRALFTANLQGSYPWMPLRLLLRVASPGLVSSKSLTWVPDVGLLSLSQLEVGVSRSAAGSVWYLSKRPRLPANAPTNQNESPSNDCYGPDTMENTSWWCCLQWGVCFLSGPTRLATCE